MKRISLFVLLLMFVCMAPAAGAATTTFDDLALGTESYWNGEDTSGPSGVGTFGGFTSGDNYFVNYKYDGWSYWDGFAYSSKTNTGDGFLDGQYTAYSANGAGGGVNGSGNYGIAYTSGMSGQKSEIYAGYSSGNYTQTYTGAYFTNNAYAYHSMINGDAVAKKFGGDSGNDEDWFLLSIYGLDANYERTGNVVEFYLADFRFADNSQDYIVTDWTWVDLSSLGAVSGLELSLSSSDVGDYGMNTPAYVAIDNLSAVPVPGAFWLLGSGLLGLAGFSRRQG